MSRLPHTERHAMDRIGWLRAAVLGANDGIVSTSSLIVGIAATSAGHGAVLTAGVAGLVAGALSMAAGEYVSVSSQADTERADLARERRELAEQPDSELEELTKIYEDRGLSPALARQVALELTAGDALAAHARDELGIVEHLAANPLQAAVTSAITFSVGAAVPLLAVLLTPPGAVLVTTIVVTLLALAAVGALSGLTGGAGTVRPALRVLVWGAIAMAVTFGVGTLFGAVV
ncbi:MAG: VIT family protein [Devosia sp.]|uniref:VIT1/CCC1 transporter family protein n=1 Tax=Devosia sp. TaxID=1871048 RepID=UPI001AC21D16|nr:VIT family protein [Devosia sp.]MBN9311281.1 VIT family protein [Devosia sp.]MBN9317416.1 VIT family protein [Devosia sp.]